MVVGAAPSPMDAVDGLVAAAGGCAVIDGGMATQLEVHGAVFDKTLWSALCLVTSPHLVKKVHMEYLEAGANVIITSSYQATIPGFLSKGMSIEEGEKLLQKSVKLAIEARDQFWRNVHSIPNHSYNRALVAASIGSYGAYLADGSEYSGNYGPSVTLDKLKDFHRRRLQVLLEAGPDMLAFETIPNKLEAKACAELLEEENVQIPSLICFSCVDGKHMASGESFKECIDILNKSENVKVVGINCAPPQFIEGLVTRFKKMTEKHVAVYPNSGEIWDGQSKRWLVHLEFLEAGADITMTCSYQATLPGFLSKGLSVEEGEKLLQKSVHLAIEARNQFWVSVQSIPNQSNNRALVAASIGSYGAYLADGSEYRGNYGPSVNLEKLKDFHRRRLQVLLEAQPDMLAFETIPNKLEAMACAGLLEEENVQIPSLISFSCVDGENMASGESFEECLAILNKSERVKVVGVNCTSPNFIESLITRFKKVTAKHIAVYPNTGEIWNAESKKWMASCNGDDKLVAFVHRWHELGASFIGGCCRTTPSDIRGISKALKERM